MIYALPVLVGFATASTLLLPCTHEQHCSIYVFAFKSIPHQFRVAAFAATTICFLPLDCIAIYLHNFLAASAAAQRKIERPK